MSEHFVRICHDEPRVPAHRLPIELGGRRRSHAFCLVSFDGSYAGKRDTLILGQSEDLSFLPPSSRVRWEAFSRELEKLRQKWRMHGVPTLKRALRLYREGQILQDFKILPVAHHFGVVPALIVDEVEGYNIGILSPRFGHGFSRQKAKDAEVTELLLSFDETLPTLLQAYYEQISFYLNAIFFSAHEERALNFCLRVRDLIVASIRGKVDYILNCPDYYASAAEVANKLREKYPYELREARAVDCLGHLIVNYVYSFFCLKHKAAEYHERLRALPSGRDIFAEDTISIMKRCGEIMFRPDTTGNFLQDVARHRSTRDQWLDGLAQTSALVSEIKLSTQSEFLDSPRIFVTHHFEVNDSVNFVNGLSELVVRKNVPTKIIRGRHVGSDIRWSVLARLWVSDYHLLFLPRDWVKQSGENKRLKEKGDWVSIELFYSQLLQRELRVIVGRPVSEALIEDFRNHLTSYTDEREIEQLDPIEWSKFIERTKKSLDTQLRTSKYIECDPENLDARFWQRFKNDVLDHAARKLIHVMFHAWCYFFDPDSWSVVQAIMCLSDEDSRGHSAAEIASFVWSRKNEDPRFIWASECKTEDKLVERVRRYLRELLEFEFSLYEGSFPTLIVISGKPRRYRLRIDSVYDLLARKFGVDPQPDDLEGIRLLLEQART